MMENLEQITTTNIHDIRRRKGNFKLQRKEEEMKKLREYCHELEPNLWDKTAWQ